MILLAIDTAANLCAACIYEADREIELGRVVLDIGTGHAERLMEVIAETLEKAGLGYPDIDAVAVSVGPGSFTGVRIGVATARGLAMALKIPAIGVSTVDALTAEARKTFPRRSILAVVDARREEIYAALYGGGDAPESAPVLTTVAEMAKLARAERPVLCGSAAGMVAEAAGGQGFDFGPLAATADIAAYARLAAARGPGVEKPRPLYLRGAGAKPQASFVLPRAG
jgi:tRNA threonylcarbamoyladenosine biosynthesis protein TsaB